MTTKQQPTKVSIAKEGLDKVTSAMRKQQRGSGRQVSIWLIVVNFNNIFSIEHLYPAGRAMNPLPSQIFNVSSMLDRPQQE